MIYSKIPEEFWRRLVEVGMIGKPCREFRVDAKAFHSALAAFQNMATKPTVTRESTLATFEENRKIAVRYHESLRDYHASAAQLAEDAEPPRIVPRAGPGERIRELEARIRELEGSQEGEKSSLSADPAPETHSPTDPVPDRPRQRRKFGDGPSPISERAKRSGWGGPIDGEKDAARRKLGEEMGLNRFATTEELERHTGRKNRNKRTDGREFDDLPDGNPLDELGWTDGVVRVENV